jgi:hypothetical protein
VLVATGGLPGIAQAATITEYPLDSNVAPSGITPGHANLRHDRRDD